MPHLKIVIYNKERGSHFSFIAFTICCPILDSSLWYPVLIYIRDFNLSTHWNISLKSFTKFLWDCTDCENTKKAIIIENREQWNFAVVIVTFKSNNAVCKYNLLQFFIARRGIPIYVRDDVPYKNLAQLGQRANDAFN